MLSVHLISGAASVPPLSLALLYKGKRLPNRVIRCAIYATSVVYHVNCRLSTVSKICIQLVYKKFAIWRSFPLPAWLSALSPAPRSCLTGTPPSPRRVLAPQVQPVPLPAQARGCKGRSPLHKKTKIPPSRREERSASAGGGLSFPFGEGGQKSKLKAGAAGNNEGKPPRQIPGWLGEPTTPQRTVSATRSINRLRQSRARRSAMCTMASPVAEPCPFMTGLRTPSRRAPPCVL